MRTSLEFYKDPLNQNSYYKSTYGKNTFTGKKFSLEVENK